MNALPRRKLREIVERHGRSVIDNPRRCEGLLRDYCGGYRREISVLVMALEEHAVADLLDAPDTLPRSVLLARLAQRLSDNLALSETAARWSIDSWAWVLGILTDEEFESNGIEKQSSSSEIEPPVTATRGQTAAQPARAKHQQPNQVATASRGATRQSASVTPAASVLVVSPSGGDYSSLNEALRHAAPGSRVLVHEGIYNESVVIDKNIDIAGEGASDNIIFRSTDRSCFSMQTNMASVRGVTIQGRGKAYGNSFFAIDVPQGALVLEDCDITSDSLSCIGVHGSNSDPSIKSCSVHDGADSGIYIFDNARATIEGCYVYRNRNANIAITQGANPTIKNSRIFAGGNGGIVVWGNGATGTIEDCEIVNHRLANVGIRQSANPVFRRCKISGGRDSGVLVEEKGYGSFEECDVFGNAKAEVAITGGSNTTLRRCIIHNGNESGVYVGSKARALVESCNIYDNDDAGVALYGESVASVRRCNIHRNGKVAVRVKERSAASVEGCDLRGNRVATWESEHGVVIERKNNRER